MSPTRFRVRACAKINLGLKIGPRRRDGFHELRTVFQTISLADRVELSLTPGRGVSLELAGRLAPTGQDNLAVRAAELAADAYGLRWHVGIRLEKRIPSGAGLGGGSSDAAAVLRALASACRTPPPQREQFAVASALGSDVPAFLLGGTVLGLGRGDEVYALADLSAWHCVLAMPRDHDGGGIATAEAFERWDQGLTAARHSDTLVEFCSLVEQVLPAFRTLRNRGRRLGPQGLTGPKVHAGIENDFESEVFSLSPDFSRIHRELRRASAAWVGLSGSGATQFGLFDRAGAAALVAARLARRYSSWRARMVSRHAYARGLQAW